MIQEEKKLDNHNPPARVEGYENVFEMPPGCYIAFDPDLKKFVPIPCGGQDPVEPAGGDPAEPTLNSENYKDFLDAEFKEHPSLQNIKDINGMAKSFIHAQSLVGHDKIPVPGEDADDEFWKNEVWSKLGLPENVDGYKDVKLSDEIKVPADFPDPEGLLPWYKEACLKYGILPKQAQALYSEFMEKNFAHYSENSQALLDEKAKTDELLKKEWGSAYEAKLRETEQALNGIIEDDNVYNDLMDALGEGTGNDPRIIRAFAVIGEKMSETGIINKPGSGRFTFTPEEAQSMATDIQHNKENPKHKAYHDNTHPDHKATVEYVQGLYKMIYPEEGPKK